MHTPFMQIFKHAYVLAFQVSPGKHKTLHEKHGPSEFLERPAEKVKFQAEL